MANAPGPRHGGEIYSLARKLRTSHEKLLDFSSNTNIFAYSLTHSLVSQTPYPFLHYPDTSAAELVDAISRHEGLEPDRILPGNGAAELIWLFLRALEPRKVLCIGPVFSEYIIACDALGIAYDILTPPTENDFCFTPENLQNLWESEADLVILCTPNNPAGITYPNMDAVLNMLRSPRVLIDNSYREFLFSDPVSYAENSYQRYQQCIRPGVSLFTLHSFTKFFCCPGIRLGYLMGDRNQIARVENLRPSWTISPFAQQMGGIFLTRLEEYQATLPPLRQAVEACGRELRRLECIHPDKVFEGVSFLCCGLTSRFNAPGMTKALAARRLLVRDCDSIPGMPRNFIRIQACPEEDFSTLLEAFDDIMADRD
ncbi:aminotransferase class I/II-fold pyridoxal phosphate-dependent enzyme [Desulfovibrio sp. OttesenSCG-928-G15]|nr:aminotransferase class I/II-fold pyridoxal phosphate-dependent enzyme [Desulfovibrio sp. OttesenSCG-928-G15]